ncbi:unnamed protein product [Adineta ricciae]|uniref:CDP-diacylglycerol--inositol 3-phosphatidyltransferase n=1 Tax=Adineta ricciae TaxID=249248 RepID=A0A816E9B4_ADIRI|nr:unnamed protein product [Adineta ricciae]
MLNSTVTKVEIDGWSVLFNVPNTLSWIRIILLFLSLRYFGKRKYLLFVVYHTISGFLDLFDGVLARSLGQQSIVGQFFEHILDQYSHFLMNACIGFLYPSYIAYFFYEIAIELWNSIFNLYIHTVKTSDQAWWHQTTFFSSACSLTIHDHPNLRLLNWYGPDIFHTVLVLRYILLNEAGGKFMIITKQHISMRKLQLIIVYVLCFTGFFALLRTFVTSCFMLEKLYKLAEAR